MLSLLQAILIPEDHLCFKIVTYLIWLLFRLLFHSYDTPCHIIILTLLTLLLPFIIIFKKKNHFLEGNSDTIQYNKIQCNIIQYNTKQYNTIQHHTTQYNPLQYIAVQCNTIQHNTIHYNTILYNKILSNLMTKYGAVQYNTI